MYANAAVAPTEPELRLSFGGTPDEVARRRFERLCLALRPVSAKFLQHETRSLRKSRWPMTCEITGRWLEHGEAVLTYRPSSPLEFQVCRFLLGYGLVAEDVRLIVNREAIVLQNEDDGVRFRECLNHEARLIVTDTKTATKMRQPAPWEFIRPFVSYTYEEKAALAQLSALPQQTYGAPASA